MEIPIERGSINVQGDHASLPSRFRDRAHAGRCLGSLLADYADRDDVIVLALPRGGVPVGIEIARALRAALEVIVVRKLGVPGHEELAFGALASGGARVLNQQVVSQLGLTDEMIDAVSERESAELARREHLYRGERPSPGLTGKTVILVDDGLATGASMRAAVAAVKAQHPAQVIVTVPTASIEACERLRAEVDKLVSPLTPDRFYAVSLWYDCFDQVSDEEVRALLKSVEEIGHG
ncbi:MAG: phosphoribosyltransferase [Gaiellaceae bacterium]